MRKLRKWMDRALEAVAGISFLAMTALTCWQVTARYVFRSPSSWSEELVSYLFGWMALAGACLVTGTRDHMNIPVLTERAGRSGQAAMAIAAEVCACLFSGIILFYGGLRISKLALGQMTSSLGVPVGFFYVALPASGVLCVVYTIMNIMDIMKKEREA